IVQYIGEVWKDKAPLLPSDPYERSQARLYDAGRKTWTTTGEAQEAAKKEFIEVINTLEGQLEDNPYFRSETFGYVNLSLIPLYCWFHAYETYAKFSVAAECSKCIAWAKRCMQKESVAKSLPDEKKNLGFVAI
ncbi:probable glutathione S-transferase, partial [Pistacia vera]|uniref:probable glutathione S-transferase n=1 Tax=Pistacia vera TaxID=55513 RepID=UPI001263150B